MRSRPSPLFLSSHVSPGASDNIHIHLAFDISSCCFCATTVLVVVVDFWVWVIRDWLHSNTFRAIPAPGSFGAALLLIDCCCQCAMNSGERPVNGSGADSVVICVDKAELFPWVAEVEAPRSNGGLVPKVVLLDVEAAPPVWFEAVVEPGSVAAPPPLRSVGPLPPPNAGLVCERFRPSNGDPPPSVVLVVEEPAIDPPVEPLWLVGDGETAAPG